MLERATGTSRQDPPYPVTVKALALKLIVFLTDQTRVRNLLVRISSKGSLRFLRSYLPHAVQRLANLCMAIGDRLWGEYHPSHHSSPSLEKLEAPICWWRVAQNLVALPDHVDTIETLYKTAEVRLYQGRFSETIELVRQALAKQEALTQAHPLGRAGIRFLQTRSGTLNAIGQLANELEFFVKTGMLGWRPPYQGILLAPYVVNPCLLDYWRPYITIVTDPSLVERLQRLARQLEFNTFWLALPNGRVELCWNGMIAIQKQWESEGRPPLLRLTEEHCKRGWTRLSELGMAEDDWFVSLHVREGGFHRDSENSGCIHRNADVNTYLPAIKEIVARGGWVVRLGDPSMKKLPPMDHVIDYACSDFKSDWMDVFCCAQARFFIGTLSGMNGLPISFGVPSVLTNVCPMDWRAVCRRDLFIPKLYWSHRENRYLNFEESMAPPFRQCTNNRVLIVNGVEAIANSSEEIREVVVEMLDRLEGTLHYSEQDEALQSEFNGLAALYESYGVSSRIGREFLQRYAYLLPSKARSDNTGLRPERLQRGVAWHAGLGIAG